MVSPSGMLGYYSGIARVLLLRSLCYDRHSVDPGPSTLETYDVPEKSNYLLLSIIAIMSIIVNHCFCNHHNNYLCTVGWLNSVGSQIVFELDHRKPFLDVNNVIHNAIPH